MKKKEKTLKYLQFNFCILLLICTLLPDFGSLVSSLFGIAKFDVSVFFCKVSGIVGGGLALYFFCKIMGKQVSLSFLILAVVGIVLSMLSLFPKMPGWLDYIGLIILVIVALISKNGLGIQWNNPGCQGAYLIMIAILFHVYDIIGDSIMTGITALFGLCLYLVGLNKLKKAIDLKGLQGVVRLKVAVILSVVAVILGWIPVVGSIVAGILLIMAFFFEMMGYGSLRHSASLGAVGRIGAGKLRMSMIVLLLGAFLDFFPLINMVVGLLSIVALWLVFQGWKMIIIGIEEQSELDKSSDIVF